MEESIGRTRLLALAVIAAALAVGVLSACGGDDSESDEATNGAAASESEAVAEAQAKVEDFMEPVTEWPGPNESAEPTANQSVVIIPCLMATAGCSRGAVAAEEAAGKLSWDARIIDGQGDPAQMNAAYRQAINVNADGIVAICVPNELTQDSVAAARDAGIAVIDICGYGEPGPNGPNVFINVPDGDFSGRALANFVIAHSDGQAQIGLIRDPTFPAVRQYTDVGERTLQEGCDELECEIIDETTITIGELETTAGQKAVSFVQANPDIDYLWVPYDGMAAVLIPALQQAGFGDAIDVVSTDGNEQNFSFIENGEMQIATSASALEWAGYAGIDELVRIFAGEEPIDGDEYTDLIATRLFTAENIPDELPWKGDLDYVPEYERLWGISG